MLRRNARLRREYLYRKSLEGKERAAYEHKMKVKEAIAEGKPLPTELHEKEEGLREQIDYDDAATEKQKTHIDDEYARAGIEDPRELKLVFPNSERMNRGNTVLTELVQACRAQICHLPYGPTCSFGVVNAVLRHDLKVPKEDSKRVMTFVNENDYISFRHHVYTKKGKEVDLREVGPRFDLKLYQIKLGTIDQTEAETEWVLRPYLNTAKKQKVFG